MSIRFLQPLKFLLLALLGFTLVACSNTAPRTNRDAANTLDGPTIAKLSVDGPYAIRSYTALPDVPEFKAATVYYPLHTEGRMGGVAVAPGFTELQRHINWWGPRLASHGFAVIVLDTNTARDNPELRGEALIAAVRLLKGENRRSESPLNGRIDTNKMAIMGHSMGGGGALIAANKYSDEIRAAIPFTPWQPNGDFSNVSVPTLIIAGAADRIAQVEAHAWPHYQSLPASTTSVYLEVAGGNHFIANSNGPDLSTMGRYGIAWLKLYLDEDERYGDFLYGDLQRVDDGKFSRYETNQ